MIVECEVRTYAMNRVSGNRYEPGGYVPRSMPQTSVEVARILRSAKEDALYIGSISAMTN